MLPTRENLIWKKMVLGELHVKAKTLGAKFMMNRIILEVKNDPSTSNIQKCIDELYEYFISNENIIQSEFNET
jgi:hypothetical protein